MLELVKDRVAVTPIFDRDQTAGGLWIPDIAKERCDQGIVKYVGSDVKDIKIGQYVIFSGYTGTLVNVEGEGSVIIMPEEFIVAVLGDVENVFVPGLYYKGRVDEARLFDELFHTVFKVLEENDTRDRRFLANELTLALGAAKFTNPQTDGYYQADFENAMNLIADAFKDKQFDVKVPKPTWNKDGMVRV